jgi:hypothetical protein
MKISPPLDQKRRAALVTGASLVLLAAGCGGSDSDPVVCVAISYWAIDITVIDAATRAPVTSASGLAIGTDFRQELSHWENRLMGPTNRKDVYTVVVSAPGYHDWIREGVEAPLASPCPQSVELVADLVPL